MDGGEVGHDAVAPPERPGPPVGQDGGADHHAPLVDGGAVAVRAQRAEVGQGPVPPAPNALDAAVGGLAVAEDQPRSR